MKFSKTTKYAISVLTYLSKNDKELHSSDSIYRALKIPKKYLQQLLTLLAKKGLLEGTKGKYGGFKLAGNSKDIFISEIVDAVEGFSDEFVCIFGLGACALSSPCPMHEPWTNAQSEINKILSSTRLSDIVT